MVKLLVLLGLVLPQVLAFAPDCRIDQGPDSFRTLTCTHLTDDDLPLTNETYSGYFNILLIQNTRLTKLPRNAFGPATFSKVLFSSNVNLVDLEAGFLGDSSMVEDFQIQYAPAMT